MATGRTARADARRHRHRHSTHACTCTFSRVYVARGAAEKKGRCREQAEIANCLRAPEREGRNGERETEGFGIEHCMLAALLPNSWWNERAHPWSQEMKMRPMHPGSLKCSAVQRHARR